MEAKHMPGPLVALQSLVDGLNATNWSSWQTTAHFSDELDAAEAVLARERLNDAAPDLLEALRELLAANLQQMPSFEAGKEAQDAWADRQAEARNNAEFIIAKVTGEQT